mmetsp:Transcript_25707/g.56691  ORF Transcript_25707/g.56691 Transcript_25707/m.56691 type:complete len:224 (+) Transcript_25707:96-767(+)
MARHMADHSRAASSSTSAPGRAPVRPHKVVFLGDVSTGKTSLIQQFMYRKFDATYQATVGVDFMSKVICREGRGAVRLQLWDTAGQERFRALIPGYLRDASACIIVYDITSRSSFSSVSSWVEMVLQDRDRETLTLALVGNKLDLEAQRVVRIEEGEALAKDSGMLFFEASARTAERVDAVFDGVAHALADEPLGERRCFEDEIILHPPAGDKKRKHHRKRCC